MISCAHARTRIPLYIDGELTGTEALELEAHLTECEWCRPLHHDLRLSIDEVRGANPLYDVPAGSYEKATEMVRAWDRRGKLLRFTPWAAALAVLAAGAGILSLSEERTEYGKFAARAHGNYSRQAFPLDITSGSPEVVSAWLRPRVPFHLSLPSYPEGGIKRYSLVGARLMQYRGEDVAYLAYEMDRKPISLLISSSSKVAPAGGESYRSGGLDFFFTSEGGLRIISWRDRGLTYAQVSDINVKGAGELRNLSWGGERTPEVRGVRHEDVNGQRGGSGANWGRGRTRPISIVLCCL